jgi:hypothetical protein
MPIEKFVAFLGTFFGYVVILALFNVPMDFPPFDRWWVGGLSLIFGVTAGIAINFFKRKGLMSNLFLSFMVPLVVCGVSIAILIWFFEPFSYVIVFLLGIFVTSLVFDLALNEQDS